MGLAFSPDGRTFLTGGGDASSGEARLWDTPHGKADRDGLPARAHDSARGVQSRWQNHLDCGWGQDRTALGCCHRPADRRGLAPRSLGFGRSAFSPDGDFVLTGSRDRTARIWPVPRPIDGDAERISLWAEVMTGMELDDAGTVSVLDAEGWRRHELKLLELGGPPGGR